VQVNFVAGAALPTEWGDFTIHGFEDPSTGKEHVVLAMGEFTGDEPVLCRVHSECLTGDPCLACAATVGRSYAMPCSRLRRRAKA